MTTNKPWLSGVSTLLEGVLRVLGTSKESWSPRGERDSLGVLGRLFPSPRDLEGSPVSSLGARPEARCAPRPSGLRFLSSRSPAPRQVLLAESPFFRMLWQPDWPRNPHVSTFLISTSVPFPGRPSEI